ncbi:MAG: nucleoside-diphosphate sugar epimerase [Thermoplasmata archaeon]|nr:MAG: nucleoside-diphosphate sugar epimerase [Thermoplasmata archaeon]
MKYKILITGGAGFIGSHLSDLLIKKGHNVVLFDNLDPQVHPKGKKPDYLNPAADFVKGDVRDYDSLKRLILQQNFDVIIHNAATVGIGQSNYEIKKFIETNALGTANILDILVNNRDKFTLKKLIIPGSNTSYGEGLYKCNECDETFHPNIRDENYINTHKWKIVCPRCKEDSSPIPTPETTELKCNSIYALSKRDQESYAMFIGKMYNIPVVVIRYFNVYGPRQSLNNPYTGVTAIFMSRLKNNNIPVVYEDGEQTRDFISVYDVAEANLAAIINSAADFQVFNVGSGRSVTIRELAELLAKLYDSDIKPNISYKFRKGDIRHCVADNSKIRQVLGWEPKIDLEDGLKKVIEWSKNVESEDRFDEAAEELKRKGLS